MTAQTDELRRRLDVPADLVPDALLDSWLKVAGNAILPWLDDIEPNPWQASVDEATLELAVKLSDIAGRGTTGQDAAGDWMLSPPPSASPGLVRSVFGTLGPALKSGGLSV